MPDDMTPEQRSRTMSRIRSTGNKSTEVRFARLLWQAQIRGWRRRSNLVGHPDFVFPRLSIAVFVDGCYWHQCPTCALEPKSNQEYWQPKLKRNVARDRATSKALRADGWSVVRIWEHELRSPAKVRSRIRRVITRRKRQLEAASPQSELIGPCRDRASGRGARPWGGQRWPRPLIPDSPRGPPGDRGARGKARSLIGCLALWAAAGVNLGALVS